MNVISTHDLSFSYGTGALRRDVLRGINLEITRGEIVIMTGPSGSGKTTLLAILGGLRTAREGSALVLGTQMVNASERDQIKIRRRSGYIFQQHNLIPQLTALENVSMTLELNSELTANQRYKKAAAILESVGLGNHLNYIPAKLSGGQRQRVSIARALVHSPELVLADEPTSALDKASGHECMHILQKLAKEQGSTVLLVTHDNRIFDVADRIVELEDGILK
jgi:putative ABC transport system ATP-binding protein